VPKVCLGKLERILPSINFRVSFLRIHRKETYKSIDPRRSHQSSVLETRSTRWENSIIIFSKSEFPADFSTKETYEKRSTGKLSVGNSVDRRMVTTLNLNLSDLKRPIEKLCHFRYHKIELFFLAKQKI